MKPHAKVILFAILVAIGMFGFSFALSPLYTKLCKSIDFYSGIRVPATKPPDLQRTIIVELVTTTNQNLNWDFYPKTTRIQVHPNENKIIYFYAKNNTKDKMVVQAIPSFTPSTAGSHFHKTECFCFNQQTLNSGQAITMPVIFHVDEDLPKTISVITLAYTLFDVTPQRGLHAKN